MIGFRFGVPLLILFLLALPACADGSGEPEPDFTIGLVTNNPNGLRNIRGFVAGMEDHGYVEGTDVTYLFAEEPRTGDALFAELRRFVDAGTDLIFTAGTPTGVAAHDITRDTGIPVVFGVIADPLAAGVLDDLTRPGGNMTGVKLGEHQGRRLELLTEIAPEVQRVLVPYDPGDTAASTAVVQARAAANALSIDLVLAQARSAADVDALLADLPADIDAIFLVPDSTVNAELDAIVMAAIDRRLPVSGPSTAQVEEGALTTYGFIHEEAGKQASRIAAQVLGGTDPGEIPVENAESFLAINLEAAEAIGLEVSDRLLRQAEIIIRPGDGT